MPIPDLAAADHSGVALLAAVIAEPDEPMHRLVYADWLLARGDPQGELILLCERRRLSAAPEPEVDARIDALAAEHRVQIAGDVARYASRFTITRGFVERVTMPAPTFGKHGVRLLALHPIRRLEIDPLNPRALERLARADALRGLRELGLAQILGRHGPLPLDAVCSSPYFDALELLELRNWAVTGQPEAGFAQLRAPRLRSLNVEHGDCAPELLAGLARNETVRLESLALVHRRRGPGWSKSGLAALGSPKFERLRSLRLDVPHEDASALLTLAQLPALTHLHVRDAPLDAIRFPSLHKLSLRAVELPGDSLPALLARHPELRALRIDQARVDVEPLLSLPPEHPLVAVELTNTNADDNRERLVAIAQRFPVRYVDVDDSA